MGKVSMRFGEVVLKKSQYSAMKSWYSQVFDTDPMFESERKENVGSAGMRQMCTI
jgi:catechol-2,3-dioxygenase